MLTETAMRESGISPGLSGELSKLVLSIRDEILDRDSEIERLKGRVKLLEQELELSNPTPRSFDGKIPLTVQGISDLLENPPDIPGAYPLGTPGLRSEEYNFQHYLEAVFTLAFLPFRREFALMDSVSRHPCGRVDFLISPRCNWQRKFISGPIVAEVKMHRRRMENTVAQVNTYADWFREPSKMIIVPQGCPGFGEPSVMHNVELITAPPFGLASKADVQALVTVEHRQRMLEFMDQNSALRLAGVN